MAEVLNPTEGIKIITDITVQPGIDTLEGVIGPLMSAARGACHFIDMPAGLYLDEHPHATESLIYTVRGQWVLCSNGVRHHMRPGSLFWFGDNIPTGFEVPFEEDAYILIFKTSPRENDEEFLAYLRGMAEKIAKEHTEGTAFLLSELPADHPALQFAATISGRS